MKNTLSRTSKDMGFFITVLPETVGTAKNAVIPHGQKNARFELLRERYRLIPRKKRHGVRIGWGGRTRSRFSRRPLFVRYLG